MPRMTCETCMTCAQAEAMAQVPVKYLDVIVEDQMLVLVALQQRMRILKLEILKLQHSFGPPTHHSFHKLIHDLQHSRYVGVYQNCVTVFSTGAKINTSLLYYAVSFSGLSGCNGPMSLVSLHTSVT